MMSTRQQLDWHFRQIDHTMEINFDNNFHFALIAHLIKVMFTDRQTDRHVLFYQTREQVFPHLGV